MTRPRRRFLYDDPERRKWLVPETILSLAGLAPGMTFADIGCGEGYFAIPAARTVGPAGRVIAFDINPESIARLKENAANEGLSNMTALTGGAESTIPCERCADIAFLGTVLHDFADPAAALRNIRAILRPGGRLANLDWEKKPTEFGPPIDIRLDTAAAARLILDAGFRIESVAELPAGLYLITATPESVIP
jgi:ubiquinone/menaquinone biosynthesis C-methylase UbiE